MPRSSIPTATATMRVLIAGRASFDARTFGTTQ
jgi:hypothetical protein